MYTVCHPFSRRGRLRTRTNRKEHTKPITQFRGQRYCFFLNCARGREEKNTVLCCKNRFWCGYVLFGELVTYCGIRGAGALLFVCSFALS